MRAGVGAVVLTLALAAGCGGSTFSSAAPSGALFGGPLPSGTFVAEYGYESGDTGGAHGTFLSLFDDRSGRHLRDLLHFDEGAQLQLAGFSRAADGSLVYAAARGPSYRGHVAGGDPRPGSCGGTVYLLDARTGRVSSLFSVGKDWTVRAPAMSPDGRSVAYLSQPCTATFAGRLVVRDLTTGAERHVWAAGTSATRVHWRGDGRELVFTVIYPDERSPSDVPGYVVVPSGTDGAQPSTAVRGGADHGCVVENAVYSRSGILLVEGCPDEVTAPARLVQLIGDGPAIAWRISTALCPNGLTAAYDPPGRLLLTATTSCGGPGAPVDVVQRWDGQHPRDVGRYVNPQQFVSGAT